MWYTRPQDTSMTTAHNLSCNQSLKTLTAHQMSCVLFFWVCGIFVTDRMGETMCVCKNVFWVPTIHLKSDNFCMYLSECNECYLSNRITNTLTLIWARRDCDCCSIWWTGSSDCAWHFSQHSSALCTVGQSASLRNSWYVSGRTKEDREWQDCEEHPRYVKSVCVHNAASKVKNYGMP